MFRQLLQQWNFFRVLRLILGVAIVVQGIEARDWIFTAAGAVFTLMAVFNAGCCAGGYCAPQPRKTNPDQTSTDITYEEVVKRP